MGQFFTFLLRPIVFIKPLDNAIPQGGGHCEVSGRSLRSSDFHDWCTRLAPWQQRPAFPGSECRHLGNLAADFSVCSPPLTHFSLLF